MSVPPRPIPDRTDPPSRSARRDRMNVIAMLTVLLVVAAVVVIVVL
jgi:hypothetical protein